MHAMIAPSAPSQRLETAALMFVPALHGANTRIWLSAPYFVSDTAVPQALELAVLRGVIVRIITTGKGDSAIVHYADYYYMQQPRNLGIEFYAYEPGFLHEKLMLINDGISTVGTANFDSCSFRLNFKVSSRIADRDFAHARKISLNTSVRNLSGGDWL